MGNIIDREFDLMSAPKNENAVVKLSKKKL